MKPVHSRAAPPEPKQPSPQMRRILNLSRWCIYGFWFAIGVSFASLSRLFGFRLLYLVSSQAISGYLFVHRPANASSSEMSHLRLSGLAVLLSSIAFWDAAYTLIFLPITIGRAVFPAWQVATAALLIAIGILLYALGAVK